MKAYNEYILHHFPCVDKARATITTQQTTSSGGIKSPNTVQSTPVIKSALNVPGDISCKPDTEASVTTSPPAPNTTTPSRSLPEAPAAVVFTEELCTNQSGTPVSTRKADSSVNTSILMSPVVSVQPRLPPAPTITSSSSSEHTCGTVHTEYHCYTRSTCSNQR